MPSKIPYARMPGQPTPEENSRAYRNTSASKERKAFYNSTPWRRLSAAHKDENPLCADCLREGRDAAAQQVHHVKDLGSHPDLGLDYGNLQALCVSCHNAKRQR
jgi:5-methylcytosine-specific restriction protein A